MKKHQEQTVSRRSFITGATMGTLGLAFTSTLAGCAEPKANQNLAEANNEAKPVIRETDEIFTADIVVVGSGMAGMAASAEAAEAGAQVILIESQGLLGGNTNFAEGVFGIGTALQKEMGLDIYNASDILNHELEFQNYNVNSKLWEPIFQDSAEDIQWLLDRGVKFDTVTAPGNASKTWHIYEGHHGDSAIRALTAVAEQEEVEIMLSTKAVAPLMDGGTVVGVQAEGKNGKIIDIQSKAVILATGGMGEDAEGIAEKTNVSIDKLYYRGAPGHDGYGIKIAEAAGGGPIKNITVCMIGVTVPQTDIFSQLQASGAMEPTNLWVNQDGVRFVNESVVGQYTCASNAIQSQARVYSIYDQVTFDRLKTDGCVAGFGMFVLPGTPCDELDDDLERYKDNENVFVADTLEELAKAMNIDSTSLNTTVTEYNQYCEAKEDSQYQKSSEFLNPVETGPFYGFHLAANNLNTMGGVRINPLCEVVNENYEVVPGLYATGMDCSGFAGETYGIAISGCDQGIALNTGRRAGIQAASKI